MSLVQDVLPGGCNNNFAGKIDTSNCIMGLIMKKQTEKRGILLLAALFIGLPLLFYVTGDVPRRTFLKESISILTIVAFCLILAQFFVTRSSYRMLRGYRWNTILKVHKILGYTFLGVLSVHPFLIVVPRYFESGVDSLEAFVTIITAFNSPGIVLGLCSWFLMLILGITSFLQKQLPLRYKTWKLFHIILAVCFTVLASWHAIELGRHCTLLFSSYVVLAVVSGALPLLNAYISQTSIEQGVNK